MRHVSKVGKRVGSVGSVCRGLNILLHTSDQVIGCNVTGLHCSLKAVSFLHIGWVDHQDTLDKSAGYLRTTKT